MSYTSTLIAVAVLGAVCTAQTALPARTEPTASAAGPGPASEPALPYTPSLNVAAMDKSVDPCVDFYQYSCGGWVKSNPVLPDQTSWSVHGKLYVDNLTYLRGILKKPPLLKTAIR